MEQLILEPLKYYEHTAKALHEQNVKEYFNGLLDKSKINAEENRATAKQFRKEDKIANKTKDKLSRLKGWRIFLIILSIISVISLLIGIFAVKEQAKALVIIISVVVLVVSLLLIFLKLNKDIKKTDALHTKQREKADITYQMAMSQMSVLNALFSEYDTFRLIEKVMPRLKFDNEYTFQMDEDFRRNFAFESENTNSRSIVNTVSGRYNDNPFMFYRHKNNYMSTKNYTGSLVISWRETVRDSNGRLRTVTRTQTLVATVTKPYPVYAYATALNYGSQIAPDLNFSRKHQHYEDWSEKKIDKHVRKGEAKLKKKAEKALLKGEQFTEMANSKFDVLFGATDRDNEVQFRVMFSPAAQLNMVRLMRSEAGYGDDFSFIKHGKHNYIVSEHSQNWDLNTSPENYYSYDVDYALENFKNFNNEYFKKFYFDFAPLLAIPTYHEEPCIAREDYEGLKQNYSEYEYEVLANSIGSNNFAHPQSKTDCILKAQHLYSTNTTDCVQISAHSYTAQSRVDFVPMLGSDGRMHSVPVPWEEYLPITNLTTIAIKRLGITKKEFNDKKHTLDNKLFSAPNAYFHGLFARILKNNELDLVDKSLEKI